MKIAIVGYGKMGRLIHQLAPEYACDVVLTLDEHNNANYEGLTPEKLHGIDVATEFSTPHTVVENVRRLAAAGVNVVVGTTGWTSELDTVRDEVERHGTGLLWSPNFSVGVILFSRVVAEAARLLASEEEYGSWAWEIHHDAKLDAPSGTLLKLVQQMENAGYQRPIDVGSNRAGRHPGTHEIGFDSAADTITLRHVARSRDGLARGALKAAQWIHGKRGVYEWSEVLLEKP